MTTITTVEQLRELVQSDPRTPLLSHEECYSAEMLLLRVKNGNGWGLRGEYLPAVTLHPRTVSEAEVEALVLAATDAYVMVDKERDVRANLTAALTALGFEVAS